MIFASPGEVYLNCGNRGIIPSIFRWCFAHEGGLKNGSGWIISKVSKISKNLKVFVKQNFCWEKFFSPRQKVSHFCFFVHQLHTFSVKETSFFGQLGTQKTEYSDYKSSKEKNISLESRFLRRSSISLPPEQKLTWLSKGRMLEVAFIFNSAGIYQVITLKLWVKLQCRPI